MLRNWKSKLSLIAVIGMFLNPVIKEADVQAAETPEIKAKAAIVADFNTGQVLLAQNAEEKMGIASMSKMILEYVVLDEIAKGNLSWDDQVEIGEYPYVISQDFNLSNVYLTQGAKYSVRELLEAVAIYSANGATLALIEHISGSEKEYVAYVKDLLASWGIENAEIYNGTGLNNSFLYGYHLPGTSLDDENKLSARDMAKIASHLLADYPEILKFASTPKKYFGEGTPDELLMMNWNWMLKGLPYERKGVDGLKTGTTEYAGATFTATAVKNNRRLISVILGATGDGLEDSGTRFTETNRMLDFGFDEWKEQTVIDQGQKFSECDKLSVTDGQVKKVGVEAGEQLNMLLRLGESKDIIHYEVVLDEKMLDDQGQLKAPVEKGTTVGKVYVRYGDGTLGFVDEKNGQNSVPLVTSEAVASANIFQRIVDQLKELWEYFISRF